jgi:hypothetical protein
VDDECLDVAGRRFSKIRRHTLWYIENLVEGFQKFAGIPFGISRIFESLMPQQISANRRKNRSIQVKV